MSVSIKQIVPSDKKPLPKPMLSKVYGAIWRRFGNSVLNAEIRQQIYMVWAMVWY